MSSLIVLLTVKAEIPHSLHKGEAYYTGAVEDLRKRMNNTKSSIRHTNA